MSIFLFSYNLISFNGIKLFYFYIYNLYINKFYLMNFIKNGDDSMTSMELVGFNTKWYRYQNNLTQEQYSNKTKFKMAYISVIETGNANLTCKNIDFIAKSFKIKPELLFNEETAKMAKKLPVRVDMYNKKSN